jgi:hypothetical protein
MGWPLSIIAEKIDQFTLYILSQRPQYFSPLEKKSKLKAELNSYIVSIGVDYSIMIILGVVTLIIFMAVHSIIYNYCKKDGLFTYGATKRALSLSFHFMALPPFMKDYLLSICTDRRDLAAIIILLGSILANRAVRILSMLFSAAIIFTFSCYYKIKIPYILI